MGSFNVDIHKINLNVGQKEDFDLGEDCDQEESGKFYKHITLTGKLSNYQGVYFNQKEKDDYDSYRGDIDGQKIGMNCEINM